MSDPVIRALTVEDLNDALALSTIVGWNQRLADWRMLLRLAPIGSFAALVDARIVGTAMGIDYGGFAWIAMMLVDPGYRGRGLGRRLLEAAMGALPANLPVRLDATPLGRPLYEHYGFEEEATLSRYVTNDAARGAASPGEALEGSRDIRPLAASDLDIVIQQDRETFSGTRGALLEWALDDAPCYAYVARSADSRINYCLGRQGRQFDQIGPVVASDDDSARALVSAALATANVRPIVVDAFDARTAFGAWLRRRGFVPQRPLVRMCRGAFETCDVPLPRVKEFAIFGPEFA